MKRCEFLPGDYRAFFEIIKEWSVKSHRNQKITSEVIINMLLSPFIGDMVSFALKTNTKVQLLAREFPIDVFLKNNDYLQYASADYLLYDRKTLYLTELKTTNTGVDGKQILNMLYNCKQSTEKIWQPLRKIIFNRIEKKNTELPTYKYLYTLSLIAKNLNIKGVNFKELSVENKKDNRGYVADEIIEKAMTKTETKDIKIIYLSLYQISNKEIINAVNSSLKTFISKDKKEYDLIYKYKKNLNSSLKKYLANPIVIEDIVKNFDFKMPAKKQAAWNLVKDIFFELSENPDNWFNDLK